MYVQSCQLHTLSSGILTRNSGSKVYADRAISGGSAFRDGYRQLLADLETGTFKGIVCEALDRLGRKLSDVADLHDRRQFRDIALHAVNLGPITTMHVGLLGTMAQLYLSDLKDQSQARPARPGARR